MNIKRLCATGLLGLSIGAAGIGCVPPPSHTSVPSPTTIGVLATTTTTSPCDVNAVPRAQDCGLKPPTSIVTPLVPASTTTTSPCDPGLPSPAVDCGWIQPTYPQLFIGPPAG